jgi:hypothetical protein
VPHSQSGGKRSREGETRWGVEIGVISIHSDHLTETGLRTKPSEVKVQPICVCVCVCVSQCVCVRARIRVCFSL